MDKEAIQWNLSITDTLGNILISEVSSFQGNFVHFSMHVAGTMHSVLIKEVSLFQECLYRVVPLYVHRCTHTWPRLLAPYIPSLSREERQNRHEGN